MHGIANDYVYIDCIRNDAPENPAELSKKISPRHTAIGSDGLILILPSDKADFRMRIFNADGSEAKMCGNGSRCVAKYVYDHRLTSSREITLETLGGIKRLILSIDETTDTVDMVTVDMGLPELNVDKIPVRFPSDKMLDSEIATSLGLLKMTAVSMGNPHGVVFLENISELDIEPIGRELETHPMWPDRANIEFARVLDRKNIEMRVWERGSGETMACGTGACAVAVAAKVNGLVDGQVRVKLRGGDLLIDIDDKTGHVMMTGPAEEVFNGEIMVNS